MLKRLGAISATVILATGFAVAIAPAPAMAHGTTMFPGNRTFLCWQDGLRSNGQIIAYNPACAGAIAQGGTTPLYNWFAVLRSDAGGRTTGYIPDGQLCSGGTGGPYDFTAYNNTRTDWPITHLTSGSTIQVRHSNWAAHPGSFRVSITPQGFNPANPLRWQDLTQIQTVTDPPASGGPGALNYYFWNLTLPSGRSGRAILYIQWIRSDSQENFFSCSDITFDGGNGQVTGIGPNQTQPPVTSTANPPPPPPPPPGPPPPPPPPTSTSNPPGQGPCTASFRLVGSWGNGFQGEVTVSAGTTQVNGWAVRWTNPTGQTISQLWSGNHSPTGQDSMVTPASWNGTINPNSSIVFGFLGTLTGGVSPGVSNLRCSIA
jgi:chitin-binding protein